MMSLGAKRKQWTELPGLKDEVNEEASLAVHCF